MTAYLACVVKRQVSNIADKEDGVQVIYIGDCVEVESRDTVDQLCAHKEAIGNCLAVIRHKDGSTIRRDS